MKPTTHVVKASNATNYGDAQISTTFLQSGYGGGENFSATASALFPYAKRSNRLPLLVAIEKIATSKGGALEFDFDLHFLGERAAGPSGVAGG